MGKFITQPELQLNHVKRQVEPNWNKVYNYYQHRGDILSSFQLIYLNVISIFLSLFKF